MWTKLLHTKQLVFIAGLHRSGTTILASELGKHPSISGLENTQVRKDEGQFLQSVYPIAAKFGGPGKFGLHKESHLTEDSELCTEINASNIIKDWMPYWDLDKSILLEKSPPNITKTRFLQRLFPKSKFIALLRHPIAVSLATQKWSKNSLDDLFSHWLSCHQILKEDQLKLNQFITIGYEDLVQNAEEKMNQIYSFLDIAPEENTTYSFRDNNEKYFEKWRAMEGSLFTKSKIKRIKEKYQRQFEDFGYSLNV